MLFNGSVRSIIDMKSRQEIKVIFTHQILAALLFLITTERNLEQCEMMTKLK